MRPWLFSRSVDVGVFGGSAMVALLAVAVGMRSGIDDGSTPPWVWIAAVLFIDVAHVHATLFRTYLDREELQRRPLLYTCVPLVCFVAAFALYQAGPLIFWRWAAYLAVFHFVRQQYGWVALYRSRAGERGGLGWLIDTSAIYASTLYPLLWWHAHLPRRFWWFVPNDFATALPPFVATIAAPLYWCALLAYAVRSIVRGVPNPGKDLVVVTTALCWYVGIIALNSDYAFTVTNVLIHGVPYFALIYFYTRAHGSPESLARRLLRAGPGALLGLVWVLAFVEEAAWDHTLWHEHPQFFGGGFSLEIVAAWLVPLLAVPQLTHYVLDGFIWRRRRAQPLFDMPSRVALTTAS
jgi:hypothetical protein